MTTRASYDFPTIQQMETFFEGQDDHPKTYGQLEPQVIRLSSRPQKKSMKRPASQQQKSSEMKAKKTKTSTTSHPAASSSVSKPSSTTHMCSTQSCKEPAHYYSMTTPTERRFHCKSHTQCPMCKKYKCERTGSKYQGTTYMRKLCRRCATNEKMKNIKKQRDTPKQGALCDYCQEPAVYFGYSTDKKKQMYCRNHAKCLRCHSRLRDEAPHRNKWGHLVLVRPSCEGCYRKKK